MAEPSRREEGVLPEKAEGESAELAEPSRREEGVLPEKAEESSIEKARWRKSLMPRRRNKLLEKTVME